VLVLNTPVRGCDPGPEITRIQCRSGLTIRSRVYRPDRIVAERLAATWPTGPDPTVVSFRTRSVTNDPRSTSRRWRVCGD